MHFILNAHEYKHLMPMNINISLQHLVKQKLENKNVQCASYELFMP